MGSFSCSGCRWATQLQRLHLDTTTRRVRRARARFLRPIPSVGIDSKLKGQAQARLKRIAGQVSGLQRMLDDDRDGIELLRQVTAVRAALMETGRVLLAAHFERCLTEVLGRNDPEDRRKRIDELTSLFVLFSRPEASP